ncbi:hypothetical protein ACHQM5_010505 [Ranunculus cassubicifolius]
MVLGERHLETGMCFEYEKKMNTKLKEHLMGFEKEIVAMVCEVEKLCITGSDRRLLLCCGFRRLNEETEWHERKDLETCLWFSCFNVKRCFFFFLFFFC